MISYTEIEKIRNELRVKTPCNCYRENEPVKVDATKDYSAFYFDFYEEYERTCIKPFVVPRI